MLKVLSKLKGRVHHFAFVISLLSLAALVAWWSVFILSSIQQQRAYKYKILELELDVLTLKLGANEDRRPVLGSLQDDKRFEVGHKVPEGQSLARRLEPFWSEFWIFPQVEVLEHIEKETNRLNFMLIGEAAVLSLIVLVSSVFLYRFVRLERRSIREVQEFWERSAHEIKTPITGLKAFLQNLKSSKNLDEIRPNVHLALKQVENQEKLAENILSGYHLKSKDKHFKMDEIDLSEFLASYLERGSIQLAEIKINLNFETNKSLKVRADAHALKVILDNITDNAIKYSQPETDLTFGIKTEGKKTHVLIQDNGPGFSPHQLGAIFQAYKHLDEELPVKKKGTGMGLYISKNLAKSMGGDLTAFSKGPGHGAVFQVTLVKIQNNDTKNRSRRG